jgi:D-threo-aldose 1-dehydrogenase
LNGQNTLLHRAALGWANLGGYACARPPTRSLQQLVVQAAHEAGIRFHDTAIDYGRGYAEEGLAEAVANLGIARTDLRIQSKVLRKIVKTPSGAYREADLWNCPEPHQSWSTAWDWTYEGVLQQAAESRKRLGIDCHDGLALHDPAEAVREAGVRPDELGRTALAALRDLQQKGELREIGIGSKEISVTLKLLELYPDVFDYVMIMNYNLLDHDQAVDELIPRCEEMRARLFLAGPYASGLLAGSLESLDGPFYYRKAPSEILGKAKALAQLARKYGLKTLKPIAVQFAAANPAVTSIVFGGRTPDEVRENVGNLEAAIPVEFWSELRELPHAGKPLIHPKAPLPHL